MNKNRIAALVLGGMIISTITSIANAAGSNSGTIRFLGRITGDTCDMVINENLNPSIADVPMGSYPYSMFKQAGDEAGGTDRNGRIDIEFINCPSMDSATIRLTGTAVAGSPDILAIDSGNGSATGVGIAIYNNHSNNRINVNEQMSYTPEAGGPLNELGQLTLSYTARYRSIADQVTPGIANALIRYDITYQ